MTLTSRRRSTVPVLTAGAVALLVGGAAFAATEAQAVPTFWQGLYWALSLLTTVGFVGSPPATHAGQAIAAVLMTLGFLMLAVVSAALASLFVRDDEEPELHRQLDLTDQLLREVQLVSRRLEVLEEAVRSRAPARQDPTAG